MPPSRSERAVVVVGALVLGVLVWLIVGEWGRYTDRNDGSERRAAPATAVTAVQDRPSARSAAKAGRLVLTASRGDCWVIVKAGSATGRQLYAGTLVASHTISFAGRRFWLSLGAASYVDARFDGKPLRGFPSGTANVAIDGQAARLVG